MTAITRDDIRAVMDNIGVRAKAAAETLAASSGESRNRALMACAAALRNAEASIIAANAKDMAAG
ncbi:MAG: gamma-glutamyl-phosphate reductase, partial [Rhodospirillales bacterium]|nr:gamma-glutamyl-phosphate reductase [Rhodospirillales bacterium]MCW8969871.1 gamma-glutamyl-phosphate reductase [Rhodospirillales bacterium]